MSLKLFVSVVCSEKNVFRTLVVWPPNCSNKPLKEGLYFIRVESCMRRCFGYVDRPRLVEGTGGREPGRTGAGEGGKREQK